MAHLRGRSGNLPLARTTSEKPASGRSGGTGLRKGVIRPVCIIGEYSGTGEGSLGASDQSVARRCSLMYPPYDATVLTYTRRPQNVGPVGHLRPTPAALRYLQSPTLTAGCSDHGPRHVR